MVSIMEIMQFCRLCLVKEQVNVPIFDEQEDIRQICEKITSCLPVKVSKEDELPKKICDGCLYKLELQYQFYNSTANAEKQLLTWLEQAKMDSKTSSSEITTSQTTVKQEKVEPIESTNEITEITEITTDPQSYMQQYQTDFQYKDSQVSNADIDANVSSNSDEPLAKRARRRRQASKPIPREVIESSDENDAGDSMMEMTVTKTEEESESDNEENVDDPEPAKYAAAGEDTEQPGPSGLGKGGTDAPNNTTSTVTKQVRVMLARVILDRPTNQRAFEISSTEDSDSNTEDNDQRFCFYFCNTCHHFFDTEELLRSHKLTVHNQFFESDEDESPSANLLTCIVCQKKYSTMSDLLAHQTDFHTVTIAKGFKCNRCEQTFISKNKLLTHKRNHTHTVSQICEICGTVTEKTERLSRSNTRKGDEPFRCTNCQPTSTKEDVDSSSDSDLNIEIKQKRFKCDQCGKDYSDRSNLRKHKKTHEGKRPFECKDCGSCFTVKSSLVQHFRIHTGEKPHHCEVCNRKFAHKCSLVKHKRIHTGEKPYLCDLCGVHFSDRFHMISHRNRHTGNAPLKCKFCPRRYTEKWKLVEHERGHTGEKPYQCEVCGKGFTYQTGLKAHEKIHSEEKPYKCNYCDKRFARKVGLENHERGHTGEAPFPCKVCGKRFRNKTTLLIHTRIHTRSKRHTCDNCKQDFSQKTSLVRHLVAQTCRKPHRCDQCQKTFAKLESYQLHLKKVHGNRVTSSSSSSSSSSHNSSEESP